MCIRDRNLNHVTALTDDTGILQHAIFTIPNRGEGYTIDDNARALDVYKRQFRNRSIAQPRRNSWP